MGHGAWYYDNGGLSGVANPDFVRVEFEPLQTRIVSLMERTRPRSVNARESLHDLASALIRSTSEIQEPASTDTWFQQLLNRVDAHISSMTELGFRDEEYIQALRNYMQVRAFCNAYRLDWLVIGKGA